MTAHYCHGRLRIPDGTNRRYMDDCYSCGRHYRGEMEGPLWIVTPMFTWSCPFWTEKPEIDEANESWPEER